MTAKTTIITLVEPCETTLAFYKLAEVGIKQGMTKSAIYAHIRGISDLIALDWWYEDEQLDSLIQNAESFFGAFQLFSNRTELVNVAQLVVIELYNSWYGDNDRKAATEEIFREVFN